MKIWYDACTGKHVRYGVEIAKSFECLGHEIILTTRNHPDTLKLAKHLDKRFIPIGTYEPTSLFSRVEASSARILKLLKNFKDDIPDVAISHQSVELCRVAFGLKIPIILTADTPHATAVNKLTIPLANSLVLSEAIPPGLFKALGNPKIFQFKGVDEVAWIKKFKAIHDFEVKHPLIVVRQMETKASYLIGNYDITEKIAHKLTSLGKVIFLSRYEKSEKNGLTIVKKFVDSTSLVAHADLVVSIGGTIAREAALQGTPSIVISKFGKTYVNRYLSAKGFPLIIAAASEVLTLAKKHLGKKMEVTEQLASFDDPVKIITKIVIENLFQNK